MCLFCIGMYESPPIIFKERFSFFYIRNLLYIVLYCILKFSPIRKVSLSRLVGSVTQHIK